MEQIIVAMLAVIFFTLIAGFLYIKIYLDDIHHHVEQNDEADLQSKLFQTFLDSYRDEINQEKENNKRDAE